MNSTHFFKHPIAGFEQYAAMLDALHDLEDQQAGIAARIADALHGNVAEWLQLQARLAMLPTLVADVERDLVPLEQAYIAAYRSHAAGDLAPYERRLERATSAVAKAEAALVDADSAYLAAHNSLYEGLDTHERNANRHAAALALKEGEAA